MNKMRHLFASLKNIYYHEDCAYGMAQDNVNLFSLLTFFYLIYGGVQFFYHVYALCHKYFAVSEILYLLLYLLLICFIVCINSTIQRYAANVSLKAEDIMDTTDRFCIIFLIGSLFLSLLDVYTQYTFQTQIITCLFLSFLYARPRNILPTFSLCCALLFLFSVAIKGLSLYKLNLLLQTYLIILFIFLFMLIKYYLKNSVECAKREAKTAKDLSRQATVSKTKFLSDISHSLELPVQHILDTTNLVSKEIKEKESLEHIFQEIKKISTASEELSSFINNIAEMNAMQSNESKLSLAPHSLETLFFSLEDIFSTICARQHQKMIFDVHEIRHDIVLMDYKHTKQLFFNLLLNSVFYTPEGGHIHVTIRELEDASGEVPKYLFIIEDNGIGMTDEFRERIFYPFERADDVVLDEVYGAGLGMTVVKHLIDKMNGSIDIASIPNVGTEITILLNFEIAKAES